MARAKSTARADARRRYRAEHNLPDPDMGDVDGSATAPTTSRSSATSSSGNRPNEAPPVGRVGIGTAFRQSFRPLDVVGDVKALPAIAIRSKALWVPALLTIASAVVFYFTQGQDIVSRFMFTYFVQTPAIGGVFLAGFLAPRASWLLGIIIGLLAAVCYSLLILTVFSAVAAASPNPGLVQDTIVSSFFLSPIMGAFFASAAAWYRRFLHYTNPNRGRAKPPEKRGPDGRSRSGNAKTATTRR